MDAVPIVPPLFRGTKNTTLHELQTGDTSRATDTSSRETCYFQDRYGILHHPRRHQDNGGKMPRKGTCPRLWFDETRGTYTIVDGKNRKRTGFTEQQQV